MEASTTTNRDLMAYTLATRYVTGCNMIGGIKHKGLSNLYYQGETKGVKQSLVKRLRYILALLNTALSIEDMNIPGLKLHQLRVI